MAIEKDLAEGSIRTSTDFLVQTNHDVHEAEPSNPGEVPGGGTTNTDASTLLGFEEWLEESTYRMDCIAKRWRRHVQRNPAAGAPDTSPGSVDRGCGRDQDPGEGEAPSITQATLKKWMQSHPVTNECTHFSCILDPKMGEIRWIERLDPPEEEQGERER